MTVLRNVDGPARRLFGYDELDETRVCYWKTERCWVIYLPGCGIGELLQHRVEEHQDGTITATPSVLMKGHCGGQPTQRHGFLERGVWREA